MLFTVGEIVHYVLGNDTRHPGRHCPAMIVRIWSEEEPRTSNLLLFLDGSNDIEEITENGERVTTLIDWRTSIIHSADKEPDTWHFIGEGEDS